MGTVEHDEVWFRGLLAFIRDKHALFTASPSDIGYLYLSAGLSELKQGLYQIPDEYFTQDQWDRLFTLATWEHPQIPSMAKRWCFTQKLVDLCNAIAQLEMDFYKSYITKHSIEARIHLQRSLQRAILNQLSQLERWLMICADVANFHEHIKMIDQIRIQAVVISLPSTELSEVKSS